MKPSKYNLSFTRVSTKFIITYSNGQFKRLEYKSGGVKDNFWKTLMTVIPFDEHHIPAIVLKYENRVVFEKITDDEEESQYAKFMRTYFLFMEKNNGFKPKIDGAEGKALKLIIHYLNDIVASEDEAHLVWSQLLNNWSKIEPFYAKQTNLKQINSNITTLLIQVKNGSDRKTQADRDADVLRKSF